MKLQEKILSSKIELGPIPRKKKRAQPVTGSGAA